MKQFQNVILVMVSALGVLLLAGAQGWGGTVTDQLGRVMVLPDNPVRIISLIPSITEIVFELGQGKRIIGVTQYSDFPEEVKKLSRVGSYVNLDLERIIALKPDLCLATRDGNPREEVLAIASMGIPVYVVNPRDLTSVMDTVLEIGNILNVKDDAEKLVKGLRNRVARVDALVSKTKLRPRVFFQIGVAPIVSVGSNTYIHELIVRAGGKNVAEGPVSYPRFSSEQVLVLSPEIMIITSMERGQVFEEVKEEWSRWKTIPAVKNNRITLVDSNILDRPTPRMVDGLELLVEIIHPEIFDK